MRKNKNAWRRWKKSISSSLFAWYAWLLTIIKPEPFICLWVRHCFTSVKSFIVYSHNWLSISFRCYIVFPKVDICRWKFIECTWLSSKRNLYCFTYWLRFTSQNLWLEIKHNTNHSMLSIVCIYSKRTKNTSHSRSIFGTTIPDVTVLFHLDIVRFQIVIACLYLFYCKPFL